MEKQKDDIPILAFEMPQAWEAWLSEHYADSSGLWLKIAKKATGITSVSYAEAVESALCYGWIDGQSSSFDEQFWLQKFTPRRPRSIWSKVNRERAMALIAAGRMQAEGLRQVELAKADGRWDQAYDGQSKMTMPDDLQRELEKHPEALAFFETLNKTNRYAIVFRVQTAKKAETRAARIEKFIAMLMRGEKIYP